jgi:hypothetical protein
VLFRQHSVERMIDGWTRSPGSTAISGMDTNHLHAFGISPRCTCAAAPAGRGGHSRREDTSTLLRCTTDYGRKWSPSENKVFAERAHAARVVLEGEDSPETIWLKRLPVVQLYWRGETSPSLLLFAEGSLPNPCRHLVFEEHL